MNLFTVTKVNDSKGLRLISISVALVLLSHGLHGLYHYDGISNFGLFLDSLGYPFGTLTAWLVVLGQTISCLFILVKRYEFISCIINIIILAVGTWVVHASNGWYVVGAGTGGMEFSILLIACLIGIIFEYLPKTENS